jgi:hypothetical protein
MLGPVGTEVNTTVGIAIEGGKIPTPPVNQVRVERGRENGCARGLRSGLECSCPGEAPIYVRESGRGAASKPCHTTLS